MTEEQLKTLFAAVEALRAENEAIKKELETSKSASLRADDYRQIMNAMAGHSYGYYGQSQEYELEHFWSKERPDIAYAHGELCYYGQSGVYNYYAGTTKKLHKAQRQVIKDVYDIELPDGAVPGYRVMNMLTTPFIEIASDRKTAQGVWMTIFLRTRVDIDGKAQPEFGMGRYAADFVNENGMWKIWHRVDYGDFGLEVKFTEEGKPMTEEEMKNFMKSFPVMPLTKEEHDSMNVKTIDIGEAEPYRPWTVSRLLPRLPVPYDTWNEEQSYVTVIADGHREEMPMPYEDRK